jgi:hypothetical protein
MHKAADTKDSSTSEPKKETADIKESSTPEPKKKVSDGLEGQNKAIVDSLMKAAEMVQHKEVHAPVPPSSLTQQKVEISV